MWIMIIKKLPTDPSPPKMSIFWSVPWPDDENANEQKQRIRATLEYRNDVECDRLWEPDEDATWLPDGLGRKEPNWIKARRINYKGQSIRVFPHEFTEQTVAHMREYIYSDMPSHELVTSDVAGEMTMRDIHSGVRRGIYDAALLDGCNDAQATAVAWGKDITIEDNEFPAIGWYRCVPEYAGIFCDEWEMAE